MSGKEETEKIGWLTAAGVVVAGMIGTGVFTSLGLQLTSVSSTWSVLLLWTTGGLLALAGAFIYAELGTVHPESGGDYIYLKRAIHPSAGYLYAWTSLTVGFSAPIAIAAMAMVKYLAPILPVERGELLAIAVIIIVSIFHSVSVQNSGRFHSGLTVVKIIFALGLVAAGLLHGAPENNALAFSTPWLHEVMVPGFAVSLVYVTYAYTGWNSAAYITGEIRNPQKNLPRALIGGTAFVTLIYVLLQYVFLRQSSPDELTGKVEIALVSFADVGPGALAVNIISSLIAVQLVSTISTYVWIGPRITHAMSKDFRLWRGISSLNGKNIPVRALWLNSAISITLVLTGTFEQILLYAGFVLQLMSTLTVVAGLRTSPRSGVFRAPLRPWLHVAYIVVSMAILIYSAIDKPVETLAGLGILVAGIILYLLDRRTIRS